MSDNCRPSGTRLLPPDRGVTVRMYNTGFGDCFLLAFPGSGENAFYMLIDCGVHHDYEHGIERIRLIVQDIARATDNKIDVVAITHEHADHLYGFIYGEEIFRDMEIGELWLSWTEDPSNPIASNLKRLYKMRFNALRAAIEKLRKAGNPIAESLERILGFDLPPGEDVDEDSKDIIRLLRSWSRKKLERPENYRVPGEPPIELPGVEGIRCYVLGPSEEMIEKLVGSEGEYPGRRWMDKKTAFMAAVLHVEKEEAQEDRPQDDLFNRSLPFDESLMIDAIDAFDDKKYDGKYVEFFRKYGDGGASGGGAGAAAFKGIDTEWLAGADELALDIDRMTNNASLVLAFEIMNTHPRKVLLFSGDAQAGSWRHWKDLQWPADGSAGDKITGEDLIRRTALYKVGHHGSLNATLREKGIDLMESPDLVAMIPVDEDWAREMGWNYPEERLLKRLMQKARGRVIRSDRIPEEAPPKRPPEATESEWSGFLKNLEWDRSPDRLWIQYTVQ